MSTFTKLALGVMGQLRPRPAKGDTATSISLPAPEKHGGLALMDALAGRHSSRRTYTCSLPAMAWPRSSARGSTAPR